MKEGISDSNKSMHEGVGLRKCGALRALKSCWRTKQEGMAGIEGNASRWRWTGRQVPSHGRPQSHTMDL